MSVSVSVKVSGREGWEITGDGVGCGLCVCVCVWGGGGGRAFVIE